MIRSWVYAALAGAKAALLALIYFKGRRDAAKRHSDKQMRADHETRTRIDQVVRDHDSADSLEFLRDRSRK